MSEELLFDALERVVEAARNHLTRTDIGDVHTPACRPGMKANDYWCSTCNLRNALKALDELRGGRP